MFNLCFFTRVLWIKYFLYTMMNADIPAMYIFLWYSCEVCNKAFSKASNLMTYQCIRSGERHFVWYVIRHSVSRVLQQDKHLHSGKHPYTCEVCGKAWRVKSSLINHEHMHNVDHPYVCNVYNKSHIHKSSLIKHKRIQNGVRPYSCEVYNKAFSQQTIW
jgi:KRAB domain-containing zinc finger protein